MVSLLKKTLGLTETQELAGSQPQLTFDMSHRAQVLLKAIIKLGISDRLKVAGVNPARGRGVAAFAHAGVVTQPALIQVGVCQSVFRRDPL